jgi:hypothetical protein
VLPQPQPQELELEFDGEVGVDYAVAIIGFLSSILDVELCADV